MSATRILSVEDHEVVSAGLAGLLRPCPDLELVGSCTSTVLASELFGATRPELVLLDLFLGEEATWPLCTQFAAAGARVVLFSGHGNAQLLDQAMTCAASGYVLKSKPLSELPAVLRAVRDQGEWWQPELLTEWMLAKRQRGERALFTDRELEIIALIADGLDNFEIAEVLQVTSHTVKFHIAKALRRSGESNRAGLVRRVSEAKLITGR